MTMTNGKTGAANSEINITPLIDVLLVLLIIFMVISPAMPRGEAIVAPKPAHQGSDAKSEAVVLEILKGNGGVDFKINQVEIAKQDLPSKLAAIYANRADRVLFLKGDDSLSFTEVADAIDIGHRAGADRIGLMTPNTQLSR